jgi:hypothetical protein
MKSHESRKFADVSNHWIVAGVILGVLGFLPVVLHGSAQMIIMGVMGLVFVAVGIYGKRYRRKLEKGFDR